MNVKQLKKVLETVPDETTIVIPGSDHDYYHGNVSVTTALYDGLVYSQDYGESVTPEATYGKRISVLVVG